MPDEGMGQSRGAGRIVTFYSFKGGTGRTMALANVAWILAANGKRVLIADWDLESPGLHKFFQPFMDTDVSSKPGIVDFIRRYEWAAKEEGIRLARLPDGAAQASEAMARLIREHVSRVGHYAIPVSWLFPTGGAIDFLTPGKQENGVYESALSALNWDTLYDHLGGAEFFDALRAHLKTEYDYILIDSRTGLSDIADICTLHLPDMVVDCFALSAQGIEGAAGIARQIQRYTARDITILPVPMRIDHTQHGNVVAGLSVAKALFQGLPAGMSEAERDQYWAKMEVPYRPAYAYEEMLAAFGDRPGSEESLLPSYERITAWITGEAVSTPPVDEWRRLRTRLRFARTAGPRPPEIVLDFSPQDQLWAEWIAAVLAGAGVYARLAVEEPAGTKAPGRVIAVVSEFYFAQLETYGFRFDGKPEQLICVTDMRIPSGWLSDVPVIFLAGRPESEAVEQLISRFGVRTPAEHEPLVGAMRYPGGRHDQIVSVPTRNPNFTGRDSVLLELREELHSRPVAVLPPLTIQGAGGVGKTQVALEYAHRFKADYDVVWWLNCGQSQYIDSSLTDLGDRLREAFDANLPEEGAEAARQVLRFLSEEARRPWLLIYDNAEAEDFDTIERLLPQGGGHVLITAREDLLADRGQSLALKVFQREESVSHLRRRMPEISEDDAYLVAAVLGDMPLAVATAGALLASERMTVPEYLRRLEGQPLRRGLPAEEYPEAVAKAWDLSLDRLERRSTAAYRLLGICSVMASVISLDLIISDAMADALRALDPGISERSMINRLIRQIDRLALIKVDYSARQIQVHQVVQAVVRDRMSEADRESARLEVHQLLVAARPAGDVDDPQMWPVYRLIWPHLTPSRADLSDRPQVRDLLVDRVRYLRQRDDLERGRRRAEEIEKAWMSRLETEQDPGTVSSLRQQLYRLQFNLANILRDLGRYDESRAVDEAVLQGQQADLGDDHPHTLQTRSSLAADLRALGEYRRALAYDLETFQAWEQNSGFGDEFVGTLNAAHNLALSYLLNGDFRSALVYDQQTIERRLQTYERGHPRTLNSGSAVARDLLEAGRYRDAVRMTQDVLAQCHEAFGDDARITLLAYLWFGIAQRCAGYPEQAEESINTAMSGLSRGFGRDSGDALASRLSQALNELALGRIQVGREAAEAVLRSYESRVGSDHPHVLICRLNIATALCLEENYATAQDYAGRAADGLEARLGSSHPYTLAAKLVLASALAGQGALADAARLEELVEDERARTLGPQHPDTLRCRVNLLLTQQKLEDPAARARREQAIAALAAVIGAEHPDVRAARRESRLLSVIDPQPF